MTEADSKKESSGTTNRNFYHFANERSTQIITATNEKSGNLSVLQHCSA